MWALKAALTDDDERIINLHYYRYCLCRSPWFNRTGCLGVERQVTDCLCPSRHAWGVKRQVSYCLFRSRHAWGVKRQVTYCLFRSRHAWGVKRQVSYCLFRSRHAWGVKRQVTYCLFRSRHAWGVKRQVTYCLFRSRHAWACAAIERLGHNYKYTRDKQRLACPYGSSMSSVSDNRCLKFRELYT